MTPTRARSAEYDAFGPWILPVERGDDVPPLFRPYVDLDGARLVMKIPRSLDRRDARVDMDLYDRLVVVRTEGLEVLVRAPAAPGGVVRSQVAAADLLAAEDSVDLLDGRLRLHVANGAPVDMPYNGSSRALVRDLLAEVRQLWRPSAEPVDAAPGPAPWLALDALGPRDVALVSLQRELATREPGLRLVATDTRHVVRVRGSGAAATVARAVQVAWPTSVQAVVVAVDDTEVVVLHRRDALVRSNHPVHSLATTVLPRTRWLRVEVVEHPGFWQVHQLRFAPTSITLDVPAGGPVEQALISVLG